MHYASETGSLPLDFELYLPEVWTNDPDRCQRAGVPSHVTYQPKWKLALAMLDRVREWGLPDQVVGADSAYGKVCEFRDELTRRQLLYVVGVDAGTGVWVPPVEMAVNARASTRGRAPTRSDYGGKRPPSVLEVARGLPAEAWQTVAWTEGSRKNPLQSRFAVLRVHPSQGYHTGKALRPLEWLLIEWPEGETEPSHYWLSTLPETTSRVDLVRQAKWRWHVEQDYRELKDELGLDHFEGRSWIGWHRHVTMTMVAFGFLMLEQLRFVKKGADPNPSA